MGDIAEMLLDGVMCQHCGCWMEDGQEPGYPRSCQGCAKAHRHVNASHHCKACGMSDTAQHTPAPDLLAALRGLVLFIEQRERDGNLKPDHRLESARAAIAKAEGGRA